MAIGAPYEVAGGPSFAARFDESGHVTLDR